MFGTKFSIPESCNCCKTEENLILPISWGLDEFLLAIVEGFIVLVNGNIQVVNFVSLEYSSPNAVDSFLHWLLFCTVEYSIDTQDEVNNVNMSTDQGLTLHSFNFQFTNEIKKCSTSNYDVLFPCCHLQVSCLGISLLLFSNLIWGSYTAQQETSKRYSSEV